MPRKWRFFAMLAAIIFSIGNQATAEFDSSKLPEGGFPFTAASIRIWVPPSFERVENVPEAVLLFLKSKTGNYPTANIVVSGGMIPKDDKLKRIISSYRLVGITSVKSVEKRSGDNDTVELEYELKNEFYRTSVTLLNGGLGRHYVLTYIDKKSDFETNRKMLDDLLFGIGKKKIIKDGLNFNNWLNVAFGIILLGLIAQYFRKCL